MRVLSIILIIALILFTAWQVYLTCKKIIDRKKKKSVVAQNKSSVDVNSTIDNLNKEEKE